MDHSLTTLVVIKFNGEDGFRLYGGLREVWTKQTKSGIMKEERRGDEERRKPHPFVSPPPPSAKLVDELIAAISPSACKAARYALSTAAGSITDGRLACTGADNASRAAVRARPKPAPTPPTPPVPSARPALELRG